MDDLYPRCPRIDWDSIDPREMGVYAHPEDTAADFDDPLVRAIQSALDSFHGRSLLP